MGCRYILYDGKKKVDTKGNYDTMGWCADSITWFSVYWCERLPERGDKTSQITH